MYQISEKGAGPFCTLARPAAENLEALIKYAVHTSDRRSRSWSSEHLHPAAHLSRWSFPLLIQHAAAAVDDQPVLIQLKRKLSSAGEFESDILPECFLIHPRGSFLCSYIPALSVMSEPSDKEDGIAVLKFIKSMCAFDLPASQRSPLYLEKRTEKDVNGISAGVSSATRLKTWLSVMTT